MRARVLDGQPVQKRVETGTVDLLAESLSRRLLEVMGLVDHEVVEPREETTAHLRIGEQKRVIDHHEVRRFGLRAGPVHVAVLRCAVHPDAVERVGGDLGPQHLLLALQAQLGAVAALGAVKPHQHLQLEPQLFGVVAWLCQVAPPPSQRDVIRAAFEQACFEIPWQPVAQAR